MKIKKILTSLVLPGLICSALLAQNADAAVGGFTEQRAYGDQFTDVQKSSWYYDEVASAYSLGLINGKESGKFDPDGNLTIAETIKLASSCHQLLVNGYTSVINSPGGTWYDGYVAYATQNGIVTEVYDNYNANATRAQVAVLLSRVLTAAGTNANTDEINPTVYGTLSDIGTDAWYAGAVYRLYRCGIMTGDSNGNINPESFVKRSEMSALVIRLIDPSSRVNGDGSHSNSDSSSAGNAGNTSSSTVQNGKLTLYNGDSSVHSFTGVTGAAADFTISGSSITINGSYSLNLLSNIVLEDECLSFRLYHGYGYEAFGIVRGWLNSAAAGQNGNSVAAPSAVYDGLNKIIYIYINDARIPVYEMWYADHTSDGYTEYAFYFNSKIDLSGINNVKFMCGKLESSTLETNGLSALETYNTTTSVPAFGSTADTSSSGSTSSSENTELYYSAINDAKANAVEIMFDHETDRCRIIYGRGLYGSGDASYRLVLIFKNGVSQTISIERLEGIRMNSSGDVLYYSVIGPDGKSIDYGVNFDN